MTESRRLRTQAEREADGTAWRTIADSRPGYATYPNTPAGDPSWFRRDVPEPGPRWVAVPPPAPGRGWRVHYHDIPPVDGEKCVRWCGFCHLNTGEPEPDRCGNSTFRLLDGRELVCTQPAGHDGGHRDDSGTEWSPLSSRSTLITNPPPRHGWWQRLTRRLTRRNP